MKQDHQPFAGIHQLRSMDVERLVMNRPGVGMKFKSRCIDGTILDSVFVLSHHSNSYTYLITVRLLALTSYLMRVVVLFASRGWI